MRLITSVLAVCCVDGCATVALREFDQRYGQPDLKRFDTPLAPAAGGLFDYSRLENR